MDFGVQPTHEIKNLTKYIVFYPFTGTTPINYTTALYFDMLRIPYFGSIRVQQPSVMFCSITLSYAFPSNLSSFTLLFRKSVT